MRPPIYAYNLLLTQLLNHFDTALYGFLAPFIAPLFFPNHDPLIQLLLAYSVLAVGVVVRPLGTYVFGICVRLFSPEIGLCLSALGLTFSMGFFSLLPISYEAPLYAPFGLILARACLDFFATGERTIASIFLFYIKTPHTSMRMASLYETSSILGIFCASVVSGLIVCTFLYDDMWRWGFRGGALFGLMLCVHRFFLSSLQYDATRAILPQIKTNLSRTFLWSGRRVWMRVACLHAFSYLTYALPFVFMTSYVPQVAQVSLAQLSDMTVYFLAFDWGLVWIIGYFKEPAHLERVLSLTCVGVILAFCLMFPFIEGKGVWYVALLRLFLVAGGVVFTCVLRVWTARITQDRNGYLLAGLGATLGSSTLGRNSPFFLLACIHYVGHSSGACIYVLLLGAGVIWVFSGLSLMNEKAVDPKSHPEEQRL